MLKHVALVNGRVIDGTGHPAQDSATILIEGSTVAAVGPTEAISLPEDRHVIDIQGKTVLPGLMDGHVHVTSMPGLLDANGKIEAQLRASEVLREYLRWGTTTIGR